MMDDDYARRMSAANARWAAFAVSVAGCREHLAAALRAPGDVAAFVPATLATLELNYLAEELADPDCSELAGRRLRTCLRVASALPAAILGIEPIRVAVDDLTDAAGSRR